MAKVGEFLAEQLAKVGIDTTDAKYKDVLAITTEMPLDGISAINSNLFTEESAKHNANLKKHFHAKSLVGVDTTLENVLEELGIEDAVKQELKLEPNTYTRVAIALKKIKELEEKKATAKFSDKKALTEEIDKLNKELVKAKEKFEGDLKSTQEKNANSILEYAIDSFLESKQYANEGAPKKVNKLTAKNLLAEDLQSKKIKVIRQDDNTLKLVQADNPDLDYREANNTVSFADYADKLLGTNKMLKVTDPPKPGNPKPPVFTGDGKQADTSKITSAIDKQLQELGVTVGN